VDNTSLLVTNAEREQALTQLREACVDGRLTLEEFSRRLDIALEARSRADLDAVTEGLRVAAAPARTHRRASRWLVAVMGASKQTGRWRVAGGHTAVAVMGECVVDLRRAEVEEMETTITACALMGEIKVIVPEGVDVAVSGVAIMGERKVEISDTAPLPGAPVVHVQAYACMGSVKIEQCR
jgi:hypothetical protein